MSVLATTAWVLGAWLAISLLVSPLVVMLVRTQARENARLADDLRRDDWKAANRADDWKAANRA
jgi:hypothetical protein